jgi:hypothetical protein
LPGDAGEPFPAPDPSKEKRRPRPHVKKFWTDPGRTGMKKSGVTGERFPPPRRRCEAR